MRTKSLLALPLLAGALLIAGCSSSSTGQATSSAESTSAVASPPQVVSVAAPGSDQLPASTGAASGEATSITIGVSESTAVVPAYIALKQGFADVGLTVKMETIQSGAEAIPRLLNGELAFSLSEPVGAIAAASNGVEIAITSVATVAPSDPAKDFTAVVALNPEITGPEDLVGRTIATNQLGGGTQLATSAAIEKLGGDPAALNFVELPFPQMIDAVQAGRVDSAFLVEPFLTSAKAAGLHTVLAPQAVGIPGLNQIIYVTASSYAQQNPDVVKRFNAALSKAAIAANGDPQLAMDTAATYLKLPPDLLSKITFPVYAENAGDIDGIRNWSELMNKYGTLDNQPDFDALLFTP